MVNFIIGFIVGMVVLYMIINSTVKNAVSVRIDKNTFDNASDLCKEYGGELNKIVAYYDRDVIYCSNFKLVAKKDKSQEMWISVQKVEAEYK